MTMKSFVLTAVTYAAAASAHGFVSKITADGQAYTGYNPANSPWQPDQGSAGWANTATDLGFVTPDALQSADIICHRGSNNAKVYVTAQAGSDVVVQWNQWPDSHHGPVMDYLAPCNGECASASKESLMFFKIAQKGQISLGTGGGSPGYWATDEMMNNNLSWTIRIPSSLKAGNYVLRHELLALHGAGSQGGAQFYPQCINIQVTGGGSDVPSGVPATSLYTATDPGVLYNIYNDETNPTYPIPGPSVAI
jgi:cellulase